MQTLFDTDHLVEYQKGNELSTTQIRSVVLASAVNTPYMLDSDRLTISVQEVDTSRVTDATELDLDITYVMEDWLPFVTLPATKLTYSRPIFVVET